LSVIAVVVRTFIWLGETLFGSLSFCALAGATVGAIAGFFFGLLQSAKPGVTFTASDLALASLLLAATGLLVVLVVFGLWQRYGAGAIFWPALIDALATSFLTVYVNNALKMPLLACPVGLLVGVVVGTVLCALCAYLRPRPGFPTPS
jgi:hypothetical protein